MHNEICEKSTSTTPSACRSDQARVTAEMKANELGTTAICCHRTNERKREKKKLIRHVACSTLFDIGATDDIEQFDRIGKTTATTTARDASVERIRHLQTINKHIFFCASEKTFFHFFFFIIIFIVFATVARSLVATQIKNGKVCERRDDSSRNKNTHNFLRFAYLFRNA